jgi:similar to stage IV sporulation protein
MIIIVYNNISRFINKCINNNINILNIKYTKSYALITIKREDYSKIKRLNLYTKIDIYKNTGIYYIKDVIKKYYYDFLMIILFLIIIYIQSNIIISVEIRHEDKNLTSKVSDILKNNGIKKFIFAKSIQELNKISDDILKDNRDILDFISINRNGMKLIVSLEERIITKPNIENTYCNITSLYDATIKRITTYKGISVIEKNQYVHKGDLLISGDITLNDEIKERVCADGVIIGNTWYKITVSYPKEITEFVYTNKHKYNISINNRLLLKNKYEYYETEVLFKIFNIKILNIKEKSINKTNLTSNEAIDLAIKKAEDELIKEKDDKITIISEKVLNVNEFNSKIELELFLSVEENIGNIEVGGYDDTRESIRHS